MPEFSTPMMKQYIALKKQYKDCILFFRLGDFYELFLDDAILGSQILGITLTARPRGKDGEIPMAGVPFHAVDSYLSKLVTNGHRVAICEQISEPNGRGIVERDVVRIVTPGTMLSETALDQKENNYLASVYIKKDIVGITVCDVTTGELRLGEWKTKDLAATLVEKLALYTPSECILPPELYEEPKILKALTENQRTNAYCYHDWDAATTKATTYLKKHFGVTTFAWLGDTVPKTALISAAALLKYIESTQKTQVNHIKTIKPIHTKEHVVIDRSTLINLELLSTLREKNDKHSLIYLLDKTQTAMGGRLLRQWLIQPLTKKTAITKRLDAIEDLLGKYDTLLDIRALLAEVADIERIVSRITLNDGNPRDLLRLRESLKVTEKIIQNSDSLSEPLLTELSKTLTKKCIALRKKLDDTVANEPPVDPKKGGTIKEGVNPKLDKLQKKITASRTWIADLEKSERERTGISSLKMRFNKVFGFYIEISKSNLDKAPKNYQRQQTLVNAERFITPELKKHEEIILTAEEKTIALELEIFAQLLAEITRHTKQLQAVAHAVAQLDALVSLAFVAEKHAYTKPEITTNGKISISEGRHPVVETMLDPGVFVPNDIVLDTKNNQLLLITGPNMAGKSVFMRQVAIITLLAHMGSYVPAQAATISLTDRIFVRSGAADAITSGLSTFMVEMVETAHILQHATPKSLIILDEIGRGTSTYDGISLAWAVAEELVSNPKLQAKTLFATHYHELQTLEETFPKKIKNYQVAVDETGEQPIFLHTVIPGKSSHSHGVTVAQLAGVPKPVIQNAEKILKNLEEKQTCQEETASNVSSDEEAVLEKIKNLKLNNLSPLQALLELDTLQQELVSKSE